LERNIHDGHLDDDNIDKELNEKRSELEQIYNYKAQGAYIRSRDSYKMDEEKPTKTFCALEKYNGVFKYVPQLIVKTENAGERLISS